MAKIWVVDGANLSPTAPNHIGYSGNGVDYDLIPKPLLKIGQIFSATPGLNYPYPTKTIVVLDYNDNKIMVELQDEQNLGKGGGTQSDLTAAVKQIGHFVTAV